MKTLTIYKSSAGSGKTYTLVFEYLKLVLKNPAVFKNILAVTFTNKATDEMKQRIIETLVDITNHKQQQLVSELSKQIGLETEQIILSAQKSLNLILHNYNAFAIQTIDSFFNKTVRALSRELGLPLNFETEIDQKAAQQYMVSNVINDAGTDVYITDVLKDLINANIEQDKGWQLETNLLNMAQELFDERFDINQKLISKQQVQSIIELKNAFEKNMAGFGKQFLTEIKKQNLTVDDFAYTNKGVANYFLKLTTRIESKDYSPSTRFNDALTKDVWFAKSKSNTNQQWATTALKPLAKALDQYYNTNSRNYYTACCILKLSYYSLALTVLIKHLKTYREKNQVLLNSDINAIIAHFISASDTPFIYEKTGTRFQHFLIDEFQDTSNYQWANFLPLIENAMSMGYQSLVVGDVKQSIYRWRGGNMQLLYEKIYADTQQMAQAIETKNLNTNYRSKEAIVTFNNMLFGAAPTALQNHLNADFIPLLNDTYGSKHVYQNTAPKNNLGGYVNISFFESAPKESNDNQTATEKYWQATLTAMLNHIHGLLNKSFTLGDMAILVRNNKDGQRVANFLIENGIENVITSDSLTLHGNIKVELLIAALQFAYTNSEVSKQTVYSTYNMCKSVFEMPDFANTTNINHLLNYIQQQKHQHIYTFFENVAAYTGLFAVADVYVQRLLDVVLEFCESKLPSPQLFLEFWNNDSNKKLSVILPPDNHSINIITIHKSKGLQFPIVLMPLFDFKINPKPNDIIWGSVNSEPFNQADIYPVYTAKPIDKSYFSDTYLNECSQQVIDSLNMLYVAFTRAEQQLFVYAKKVSSNNKINTSSELLYAMIQQHPTWCDQLNHTNQIQFGSSAVNTETKRTQPICYLQNFIHQPLETQFKINAQLSQKNNSPKTETGINMHLLLSKIYRESDITDVIAKSNLNTLEKSDLQKLLKEIMTLTETTNWFNGSMQVFNEQEIIFPNGVIKRPDRLMIDGNNAIIVDYKTGIQKPEHIKQINEYDDALKLMGFNIAAKYVLYLSPLSLIKC
jgi:ATP-dependent helicase/nuclease subunit A